MAARFSAARAPHVERHTGRPVRLGAQGEGFDEAVGRPLPIGVGRRCLDVFEREDVRFLGRNQGARRLEVPRRNAGAQLVRVARRPGEVRRVNRRVHGRKPSEETPSDWSARATAAMLNV